MGRAAALPPRQKQSGRAPRCCHSLRREQWGLIRGSLSVRPSAKQFFPLSLSFHICEMGIIIAVVKNFNS